MFRAGPLAIDISDPPAERRASLSFPGRSICRLAHDVGALVCAIAMHSRFAARSSLGGADPLFRFASSYPNSARRSLVKRSAMAHATTAPRLIECSVSTDRRRRVESATRLASAHRSVRSCRMLGAIRSTVPRVPHAAEDLTRTVAMSSSLVVTSDERAALILVADPWSPRSRLDRVVGLERRGPFGSAVCAREVFWRES